MCGMLSTRKPVRRFNASMMANAIAQDRRFPVPKGVYGTSDVGDILYVEGRICVADENGALIDSRHIVMNDFGAGFLSPRFFQKNRPRHHQDRQVFRSSVAMLGAWQVRCMCATIISHRYSKLLPSNTGRIVNPTITHHKISRNIRSITGLSIIVLKKDYKRSQYHDEYQHIRSNKKRKTHDNSLSFR